MNILDRLKDTYTSLAFSALDQFIIIYYVFEYLIFNFNFQFKQLSTKRWNTVLQVAFSAECNRKKSSSKGTVLKDAWLIFNKQIVNMDIIVLYSLPSVFLCQE